MDLMDRGNLAAAVRHSSMFTDDDGTLNAVRWQAAALKGHGCYAAACAAAHLNRHSLRKHCTLVVVNSALMQLEVAFKFESVNLADLALLLLHLLILQVRLLRRAADVAAGVSYLHSRNVCHGDLKCENVLLRSEGADPNGCLAKVADFGLSRALAHGQVRRARFWCNPKNLRWHM
jgi:hypothetical protein